MTTTVISVRGINGERRQLLIVEPDFLYVGRAFAGWPASIWGNPFKRGMTPRQAGRLLPKSVSLYLETARDEEMTLTDILDCYEAHVRATPKLVKLLPQLRNRRLGCWCGSWQPGQPDIGCHAVILAKLADATEAHP